MDSINTNGLKQSALVLIKMCTKPITATFCILTATFAWICSAQSVQYTLVLEDDGVDIIRPCDDFPGKFLDEVIDLTQLEFKPLDDDGMNVGGKLVFIKQYKPNIPITLEAQIFKKSRGQWVDTIYNFRRTNFCPELYDSSEYWYQFTKIVPEDKRKCPPDQNLTIALDVNAQMKISLPDRAAEGEYMGQVRLTQGDDTICFSMGAHAYKLD